MVVEGGGGGREGSRHDGTFWKLSVTMTECLRKAPVSVCVCQWGGGERQTDRQRDSHLRS